MKLAEFANNCKVSERHVRRLIKKYEADMVGHYEQRGNEGTFLDDVGVEFLKSKLRTQVDVMIEKPSERERQLEQTLTALSLRYADAMEQLAKNAGAAALLEAAKEKELALEARTSDAEERAARAAERADVAERQATAATQGKLEAELALEEAKADRAQMSDTLEKMRLEAQFRADAAIEAEEQRAAAERRAETAEDVAELNAQEAARAKAEAEEFKLKLEQIAAARGLKRRKLLKELKKERSK